jgi:hypothetical protein
MKTIEMIQKLSILHCLYQMIASADGAIDEQRDQAAIDIALSELELPFNCWDRALGLNPHDCFIHLSSLNVEDKQLFRNLLLKIADMGGNTFFRVSCANHIFQLANC